MSATVKQLKDTLETMRSVYRFNDEKTVFSTASLITRDENALEVSTTDEKTGVQITMEKCMVERE